MYVRDGVSDAVQETRCENGAAGVAVSMRCGRPYGCYRCFGSSKRCQAEGPGLLHIFLRFENAKREYENSSDIAKG